MTPKHIVLLIHGYVSKPNMYRYVEAVIKNAYPGAKVLVPGLPLSLFSTVHPNAVVKKLQDQLDEVWRDTTQNIPPGEPLPKIVIIGHSAGSLLARKLYIVGCGENEQCRFEDDRFSKMGSDWAKHVDRLVLLAGTSNGWTKNEHFTTARAIAINILIPIGTLISIFRKPFIFHMRKGSSFVSNLRLQWIWMTKHPGTSTGHAMTIQLLGTIDDIVPPADNIDQYSGTNFIYLEVPDSGHINVLDMDETKEGENRAAVLRNALLNVKDQLLKQQEEEIGTMALPVDEKVTDVAFVIHGIRDTAYWTQKMANRIRAFGAKNGRKFATETSSYGYFSMLHFFLPYQRHRKMEWLVDQYIENLSLYPNACDNFSFFGHSNGTYLLASALKRYPMLRFKNVVLAGSVVHKQYAWNELRNCGRISNYLNLVATKDWVVGIFPKAFEQLSIQDLGAGGFDGFNKMEADMQLRYIDGAHGEGTAEKYWNEIAYFIVNGARQQNTPVLVPADRPTIMKIIGSTAPLPFLAVLAIVILVAIGIWFLNIDQSTKWIMSVLYFVAVWRGITCL